MDLWQIFDVVVMIYGHSVDLIVTVKLKNLYLFIHSFILILFLKNNIVNFAQ